MDPLSLCFGVNRGKKNTMDNELAYGTVPSSNGRAHLCQRPGLVIRDKLNFDSCVQMVRSFIPSMYFLTATAGQRKTAKIPVFEITSKVMRKSNLEVGRTTDYESVSRCISRLQYVLNNQSAIIVGASAPQVGFNLNIVGVKRPAGTNRALILINPRIIKYGGGWQVNREGCLSLPGRQCQVRRRETVIIDAIIHPETCPKKITFQGLASAIVQHEIDHLRNRLWTRWF